MAVDHWATLGEETLASGHFSDNTRSRKILINLGFRDIGPRVLHSNALGREVESRGMELARSNWEALRHENA